MLKGIINKFFGRKPTIDDAKTVLVLPAAQVVMGDELPEWQRALMAEMERDTGPKVTISHPDAPQRRRGKSRTPKMVAAARSSEPKLNQQDDAFLDTTIAEIKKIQAEGITSQNGIARELNRRGFKTRTGKQFMNTTVANILAARGLSTGGARVGGRKAKPKTGKKVGLKGEIKSRKAHIVIVDDIGVAPAKGAVKETAGGAAAVDRIDVTDAVLKPKDTNMGYEAVMDMLSPKTRRRADIVNRHKRAGGKMLTKEEIDAIERKIAAGDVIRYPAGLDSDGNNHFEQAPHGARPLGMGGLASPNGHRRVGASRPAAS